MLQNIVLADTKSSPHPQEWDGELLQGKMQTLRETAPLWLTGWQRNPCVQALGDLANPSSRTCQKSTSQGAGEFFTMRCFSRMFSLNYRTTWARCWGSCCASGARAWECRSSLCFRGLPRNTPEPGRKAIVSCTVLLASSWQCLVSCQQAEEKSA